MTYDERNALFKQRHEAVHKMYGLALLPSVCVTGRCHGGELWHDLLVKYTVEEPKQ